MCGIFGFRLSRALTDADIDLGLSGIKALNHRGPDHLSHYVDRQSGIFLGHTRLSVIDLSDRSHQPMKRGNAIICYNGEIYNYLELAESLSNSGINLSSSGDTEVLIESWLRWGPNCLDRFDGMFAFAILQNQTLHLAVDPFGEKPMYWVKSAEGFFFASEPQPLVELLKIEPDLTAETIATFLGMGFLPAPSTGYDGLKKLAPGTRLSYSPTGNINMASYWKPNIPESRHGPVVALTERQLDSISGSLIDSLRVRYRADVPIGLFLSSGVDSALIAALTVKELDQQIEALTVKFQSAVVDDESESASKIARHLKLPHVVAENNLDPKPVDPSTIFSLYGELNDNLTVQAALQMSLIAVRHEKVVLSGIGGDELFYGYNRHQFFYRWKLWLGRNQHIRRLLNNLLKLTMPRRASVLKQILAADDEFLFTAVRNLPAWGWLKGIHGLREACAEMMPDDIPSIDLFSRHVDLTMVLPGSFIPAIERGSMRASLEVRTPFLNRQLLDIISEMDQRAFLAFGQKSVLRRILKRYLPDSLITARKRGFNYPTDVFLSGVAGLPLIPNMKQADIFGAWSRRSEKGWRDMAVRLALIDHFARLAG